MVNVPNAAKPIEENVSNIESIEELKKGDTSWYVPEIRGHKARPPFGYSQKGGDPDLLVPDPVLFSCLSTALDQLDNGISLREATDSLNLSFKEKGYSLSLSHTGLKQLRVQYRPDYVRKSTPAPNKKKRLSREKRSEAIIKKKIANIKKSKKAVERQLNKLAEKLGEKVEEQIEIKSPVVELPPMELDKTEFDNDVPVAFEPNPGPQTEFLAAEEQEVLFGGAAGGGKSMALLADVFRFVGNKHFNGLILRRTNDELRDLIKKSDDLYPSVFGNEVQFHVQKSTWTFPSGAKLWMTYFDDDRDFKRFIGQEYTYIAFDELTQWPTPQPWLILKSRLRTKKGSGLENSLFMRGTTNPGGPGHGWVKLMFIDPAPFNHSFWARNMDGEIIKYPDNHRDPEKAGKPIFRRRFIPSKLSDNPYLFEDGNYEAGLLSLPEQQRRQLLEGDWNIADGAAFSEFRESIHVCPPRVIPSDWRRFRSCDWGYSDRSGTAVHWFAINPMTGQLVVYRELYVFKMTATEVAKKILELEKGERISYGVLDFSTWAKRGATGVSPAEEMIKAGCKWRPADNKFPTSRAHGRLRLHELLRVDPVTQEPGIIFFDSCRKIISTLPVIPTDPDGTDDIDQSFADDHAYDSIRYGVLSRPKLTSNWEPVPTRKYGYAHRNQQVLDPVFGY